jgi:hypothetical protein
MDVKISLYQWVVSLIPGSVFLVCLGILLHTHIPTALAAIQVPDALGLLIFVTIALVTGEVLQGLGSMLQPIYFLSWGGRTSDKILKLEVYKKKAIELRKFFDVEHDADAFDEAMALVNGGVDNESRVTHFNISYGYIRSLLTGTLIILAVTIYLSYVYGSYGWSLIIMELLLLAFFWYRTKQRSSYYAKEVIDRAYSQIKSHAS